MSDFYTQLAAALRGIAEDLDTLAGQGLAEPYILLSLSFHGDGDAASIAAVNAAGTALLGKPGVTKQLGGGAYHHSVSGNRGPEVHVSVYDEVSSPEQRALQAEIERSRAELEQLRAELDTARAETGSRDDGSAVTS